MYEYFICLAVSCLISEGLKVKYFEHIAVGAASKGGVPSDVVSGGDAAIRNFKSIPGRSAQ